MLDFERQFAAALLPSDDPARLAAVEAFVGGSLDEMPEFLRLGVFVESVAFATFARLRGTRRDLGRLIEVLERSPISLVRQYVRLFRSLVLFVDEERAGAAPAG